MPPISILSSLFFTFATSFLFLVLVRKFALKFGIVDLPGGRKVHSSATPRLGGVGVTLGYLIGTSFVYLIIGTFDANLTSKEVFQWIVGPIIATGIGVLDDFYSLGSKRKLAMQLALGVLVFISGYRIQNIDFGLTTIRTGDLSLIITVLYIAFLMNAINLIDGIDGLAAGSSFLSLLSLGILAWAKGAPAISMLCLVSAFSTAGFLPFNFSNKYKTFMGDSGSLFLGYMIAMISIRLSNLETSIPIYSLLLFFAYPIMDTWLAILRRVLRELNLSWDPLSSGRKSKKRDKAFKIVKGILTADGDHIHHRLLQIGLSTQKSALLLCTSSLIACGLGFLFLSIPPEFGWLGVLFTGYAVWQFVLYLDYEVFQPRELRRVKTLKGMKEALGNRSFLVKVKPSPEKKK